MATSPDMTVLDRAATARDVLVTRRRPNCGEGHAAACAARRRLAGRALRPRRPTARARPVPRRGRWRAVGSRCRAPWRARRRPVTRRRTGPGRPGDSATPAPGQGRRRLLTIGEMSWAHHLLVGLETNEGKRKAAAPESGAAAWCLPVVWGGSDGWTPGGVGTLGVVAHIDVGRLARDPREGGRGHTGGAGRAETAERARA